MYFFQHHKGPLEGFALPLDSPQYSKILFIKYLPILVLENLSTQPTVMLVPLERPVGCSGHLWDGSISSE